MNRITLRTLLVLLLTVGILITTAACKREEPEETVRVTEAVATTEPTTAPTETEAPTTAPTETQPQEERFLLTFVGDCTFGASPANYHAMQGFIKTVGEDYQYPFRNVIDYFANDDCSFINLEGALCRYGYPAQKKHTFRGPMEYSAILTENSVEAVTLANNHTLDYGQTGYDDTLQVLQSISVPYAERDSSVVFTLDSGLTIGLYGCVYYKLDVEDMVAEIEAMKAQNVDLIIVAPHWGAEGAYRATDTQVEVGHAAIDAGAHIVWGSHPHVLQPIEAYNGGIIYYSLGNFSFGGNAYPGDYDTALLQQEVIRSADGTVTLGELTIVPCSVSSLPNRNNYQPTPYAADSQEYARVISKLDGSFTGLNLKVK